LNVVINQPDAVSYMAMPISAHVLAVHTIAERRMGERREHRRPAGRRLLNEAQVQIQFAPRLTRSLTWK